jgi:hypothetical protein
MMSHVRIVLILLAMLWQAVAVLSPNYVAQRSGEATHWLAHARDTAHHHHDDRSLHMDNLGGSVVHQHADGSLTVAGWLTGSLGGLPVLSPKAPAVADLLPVESPFIEGLLRPPSPIALA